MIGLSLSAIGGRPLDDCLRIADELAGTLGSSFLELAVGVDCRTSATYGSWPLVLHDSCLRDGTGRRRLDLLRPPTWSAYRAFIDEHDVRLVGVHAPARQRCTATELEAATRDLEDALGVPVAVEVMPHGNRWCSDLESIPDVGVLLDVSHVLIWSSGDEVAAEQMCRRILGSFDVREIHLSHNGGRQDSHDLIPDGRWFEPLVAQWSESMFVTYESLPASLAEFERADRTLQKVMRAGRS